MATEDFTHEIQKEILKDELDSSDINCILDTIGKLAERAIVGECFLKNENHDVLYAIQMLAETTANKINKAITTPVC